MMLQKMQDGEMSSDMVKIKLNGVVQENVYYYVSANLVEDFSHFQRKILKMHLSLKLTQQLLILVK